MTIYVKVNDTIYPASITGRMNDKDWNNRESKAIKLEMTYDEAVKIFIDDVEWYIVEKDNDNIETYDNSDFSIAGDIIDHRDGTITVKMGKPTAEEILNLLVKELSL